MTRLTLKSLAYACKGVWVTEGCPAQLLISANASCLRQRSAERLAGVSDALACRLPWHNQQRLLYLPAGLSQMLPAR